MTLGFFIVRHFWDIHSNSFIRARGCRAAYFGPWVRWGRGFGWGAMSVCLCVCLCVCSGWVAACWLFLVLSKERRRGRATHPGDPPRVPGDPPRDPTLILTLGPKFYLFSVFSPRISFCFCKTILYSGNRRIFRDLAFGSVKTRFKAILKKLDFSAQSDLFMNFCPRRATKVRSL